jgi:gluconate transporter
MQLLILLLAIGSLLAMILWLRLNAFLALIITALGTGLALGMSIGQVVKSVETGVGSTLGQLAMVIGFGAMLGELLAQSGAIQRITDRLIALFGRRYIHWAILITAFVVGIPMFFNAAFMVFIPIVYSLAARTGLPLLRLGIPMVAALSVTHGYLPPHPGATAISNLYKADMAKVMLYGIIVGIPAVVIGGVWILRFMDRMEVVPPANFNDTIKEKPTNNPPSMGLSLFIALSPLVLMAMGSTLKWATPIGPLSSVGALVSDPAVSMLLAVLLAIYWLGVRRGVPMSQMSDSMGQAIQPIAMILLIIGGGGALKQVLVDSGMGQQIGEVVVKWPVSPLFLAWLVTAILRVCLGSSTVAGLTAVGLMAPLAEQAGVNRELLALATGSGSIFFSNVNDTGFWMFKSYFGTTIGQTFRSWSLMEAVVSVVGLLGVFVLSYFV